MPHSTPLCSKIPRRQLIPCWDHKKNQPAIRLVTGRKYYALMGLASGRYRDRRGCPQRGHSRDGAGILAGNLTRVKPWMPQLPQQYSTVPSALIILSPPPMRSDHVHSSPSLHRSLPCDAENFSLDPSMHLSGASTRPRSTDAILAAHAWASPTTRIRCAGAARTGFAAQRPAVANPVSAQHRPRDFRHQLRVRSAVAPGHDAPARAAWQTLVSTRAGPL